MVVALFSVFSAPVRGHAASWEKLVMPGPLIAKHARYEDQCERCHEPYNKQGQPRLCLACHEDVADDLTSGRGFHGRSPAVASKQCKECHSDHLGRDADVVGLDRDRFEHQLTDFPLLGAHARVECDGCHAGASRLRDAPGECIDCHRNDDHHRGRLGEDCEKCHDVDSWKNARFDHDTTDFLLTGAHVRATCAQCHPNARYHDTPTECVACHRADDAHRGRYGRRCQDCHDAARWKPATFVHDKHTKYPLRGRHVAVACNGCHAGGRIFDPVASDCYACHRSDDAHKGKQGTACASCHNERGWKVDVRFDHDRSAFPLVGKHAAVRCEKCHATKVYADVETTCNGCHARDDSHRGALGAECAACHNPNSWRLWRFDHNLQTSFLLDGAHRGLACDACHTPFSGPPRDLTSACIGCHGGDDVHAGRLGPRCERCHSTQTFNVTRR